MWSEPNAWMPSCPKNPRVRNLTSHPATWHNTGAVPQLCHAYFVILPITKNSKETSVLRDMTPRRLVEFYTRFGKASILPKRWELHDRLHGVTPPRRRWGLIFTVWDDQRSSDPRPWVPPDPHRYRASFPVLTCDYTTGLQEVMTASERQKTQLN